jgi:uncharacterized membrane protein YfcA
VTAVFLFAVAFLAGALNAVAGGGSFLTLPSLIYAGVAPVAANATSTFALWPGSVASSFAYRREVVSARGWLLSLGAVSLVGGLLGALLLVRTSDASFIRLLPWLMLLAAVTFTFGGTVTARLRRRRPGAEPFSGPAAASAPEHRGGSIVPWWAFPLQLVIAIYGGYFGGGIGIMMLASLAIAGMIDMHEMNGVKTVLAVAINGIAMAEFVLAGSIAWLQGFLMMAGGIAGGYVGASFARQLPPRAVRSFVIVVAWVMTVYFFAR